MLLGKLKMKNVKGYAFRITAKSVAKPLTFDEIRNKYGATAKDAAKIRLFVFSNLQDRRFGGRSPAPVSLKLRKSSAKASHTRTRRAKIRRIKGRKARKK